MATVLSKQTAYYDNITLRKILAKSTINSVLPPFHTLTSDGLGGTYWSTLSSPNAYVGAFQYICTPAATYTADASFNQIQFKAVNGVGFSNTQIQNQTVLYSKSFENIQVPFQNTIVSSSIYFSSFGTVDFETNENLLAMSIVYPTLIANSTNLVLNDTISTVNIVGKGDILLSTTANNLITAIQISTFRSEEFISMESFVSVNSLVLYPLFILPTYVSKTDFSTGMSNLSTTLGVANSSDNNSANSITSSIQRSLGLYSTFFSTSVANYNLNDIPYHGIQASSFVNSISTFSSLLGLQMEPQTIASTTNIFGKRDYTLDNINYISNNIYIFPGFTSSVSTPLGIFFSSCATESQLQSTVRDILSLCSTTEKLILPSTTGSLLSSFSTTLTNDIRNLTASSITRANFVSSFNYTLLTNSIANGVAYDVTLSTVGLNLQPLTKFIDADSKVYIQYNINYAFKNLRKYISDGKVLSVNEYPVSTFLTYNNQPVPNLAYTDYMQFPVDLASNVNTYVQTYSKQVYFQLDTPYLLQNSSLSYTLVHFHSSIVFWDNKHATSNVFGGIVYPNSFTCDCSLVNYTTVEWSNLMPYYRGGVKVFVENGFNYPRF